TAPSDGAEKGGGAEPAARRAGPGAASLDPACAAVSIVGKEIDSEPLVEAALMRNGLLLSAAALLASSGVLAAQELPAPASCAGPPAALGEPLDGPPASPGRAWVSAEYLLWWIKNAPAPPLVTASPAGTAGIH